MLILGETGVGKELVAHAVHARSPRANKPFLSLNCAAVSETLLEAELFGHEKGAFTGAVQSRAGIFEAASGGTVFLDEVGELTLTAQAKLLRVLENRTVTRLGARKETPIDVRLVSATIRNLRAAVASGSFRQDLLFRLNSLVLTVPPLRDRPSEIEPLAEYFLKRTFRQVGRKGRPRLAPDALAVMKKYPWPGNVRELRNAMERAAVLSSGTSIQGFHLPPELWGEDEFRMPAPMEEAPTSADATPSTLPPPSSGEEFRTPVRDEMRRSASALERTRILEELSQCGGNQTKAAARLGMSRRTLVTRLVQYDLPRPRKTKAS